MKNNKEKIETMSKKILIDEDGCLVEYIPGFLGTFESTLLKDELSRMPFQQKSIKMFGKTHLVPRFTCSVVFDKDEKLQDYIYSGIKEIPVISPPILAEVHRQIEKYSGDTFNYGLLNYYRNGGGIPFLRIRTMSLRSYRIRLSRLFLLGMVVILF